MADQSALSPDLATAPSVPWPQVERFIGLFTHDVRNGLNALELQLTFLGEISDDPDAKAEVKRMRGSVAEITRQLQAVRLAAGTPAPHAFSYPAADFAEDLRERFNRQRADTPARVQWEIEPGTASVEVDPELSLTALLELLANALFHAAEGSVVRVHAACNATAMSLSIRQTLAAAPATSPESWGRTPFSSSRRDGYGLGAFRARRIIESQEGTLRFTYSEADQSLVTTVMLPAAK